MDFFGNPQRSVAYLNPSDLSHWSSIIGQISPDPTYVSCSTQNQDPDAGITTRYCVCSHSTFPISTSGTVVCAYTSPLPTVQASISTWQVPITYTGACKACTLVGGAGGYLTDCSSMSGCTPAPTCTAAIPRGRTTFYVWNGGNWRTSAANGVL